MRPPLSHRPWFIATSAVVCVALGLLSGWWLTLPGPSTYEKRHTKLASILDDERPAGMSRNEFAARLAYGRDELAPRFVALLAHFDPDLREAAAECLRSAVGTSRSARQRRVLDESAFEALKDAHRRGLWVADAIGAIDTPAAHDFLIDTIQREPENRWYLIRALGSPAAIAAVTARLRSPTPVESGLARTMHLVVRGGRVDPGDPVIAQLVSTAQDPSFATANRRRAIHLLGTIGPEAGEACPALDALAAAEPELAAGPVPAARLQIDAHDSTAARVARIEHEIESGNEDAAEVIDDEVRAIAKSRSAGREAGPMLVRLARHGDGELRHAAVVALAYVDFREPPVAGVLIDALRDPDDWLLNQRAADALGRLALDDPAVRDALHAVGEAHWDPATSARARDALRALDGHGTYERHDEWQIHAAFFEDADRYHELREAPPEAFDLATFLSVRSGPGRLSGFQARLIGRQTGDVYFISPYEGYAIANHGPPEVHCGVCARDGYILGEDHGEFGSGLFFVDRRRRCTLLGLPNVYGIYRMSFGIVAVTGAAMIGDGALWLIDDSQPGVPKARRWKRLPFDPGGAGPGLGLLPNGDLLIRAVILTRDGRLEWTPQMHAYLERRYGPAG